MYKMSGLVGFHILVKGKGIQIFGSLLFLPICELST